MKPTHYNTLAVCISLCLLLALTGCGIERGVKYTKTIRLTAPLAPGSAFAAETHNGSITVCGEDVADCNLIATIVARAQTQQDAQMLADQVEVKLEPYDNKLETRITKPILQSNQSVSVSLDLKMPHRTGLHLKTHNGEIEITAIAAKTDATTYNGNIIGSALTGQTKVQSYNGRIELSEVSGDTYAETYNGNVRVVYLKTAPPVCKISIVTHNGRIILTTPPEFSATVKASTHNGSIKTHLPVTIAGEISKTELVGTIGKGEGKLELETYNGQIYCSRLKNSVIFNQKAPYVR